MDTGWAWRAAWGVGVVLSLWVLHLDAAGPERPSRVPPPGIPLTVAERVELREATDALGREIEALRSAPGAGLLPDVEVYHRAVDVALRHDEFLRTNDIAAARVLLQHGRQRALELREGRPTWPMATGLVVRGFVSRLDGSVQPYGMVVPVTSASEPTRPRRLDVWLHGRDDTLTELRFLAERERSPGEFTPPDALVLHPYGRYCNAFKFAGEVDVLEALDRVRQAYAVDDRRIAVRGFSMGGAGTWHLAVHHPGLWAVAAPGAGFAETAEYQKIPVSADPPSAIERRLWQLYDATDYAANLRNLPLVAYDGTLDPQRQAAEIMERALRTEGLGLHRIRGTNVGHRYTPEARREVARFVDDAVAAGKELLPEREHFTTRTLRHARGVGVEVLGLGEHWKRADVVVDRGARRVLVTNVVAFTLHGASAGRYTVDGQAVDVAADGGMATFRRTAFGRWTAVPGGATPAGTRKSPGLQGPIDDAFLDSFLFVRPTGTPTHPATGAWMAARLERAIRDWRAEFRGEVRVKDDVAVTDADMAAHHVILWGDPGSNRLLARMAGRLPLRWDARRVRVGRRDFQASTHVPVLVCPNPLAPRRYVVLNSGFTFAGVLPDSNARQTPRLPDYAVFDVTRDATPVLEDFLDESWRVR